MTDKFILIDGNSLANRAFYAIPMLSNSQGLITNAVYGFCNMLKKILEEEKPRYLAVAFDKGRIVFRHKEYENYKATRKGTPEELKEQFPVLKDLLRVMNVASYELEDYEADDLIGTLVKWGEDKGMKVAVVTGDKDALQLVSEKTRVLLTKKGITELECYDEKKLYEKYELEPRQIIELKGLMGDASDNIPGIPGVGEKTALKLLKEHDNIENVLANKGAYSGKKLGALLEEYGEQALLSRRLATIECRVPMQIDIDELRVREPDYPALIEKLKELEFNSLLQDAMAKAGGDRAEDEAGGSRQPTGRLINSGEELREALTGKITGLSVYLRIENRRTEDRQKKGHKGIIITGMAVKPETDGQMGSEGLCLAWQDKDGLKEYLTVLKPFLEEKEIKKTLYDGKTAIMAFAGYGVRIQGIRHDVMLMSYLLHPERGQGDQGVDKKDHSNGAAYVALEMLEETGKRLEENLKEHGLLSLYSEVELPLSCVLAEMEMTGVCLDCSILEQIGTELDARVDKLTTEIYRLAGEEFNINSPKQLGVILFEKLGLPKGKKTKTGYSTNAAVLESLAYEHEIVDNILLYRQLVKLKTTYIDGLRNIVNPYDKRVYTSFNQAVTATGRLSSTEPNLQNIPIRMEEGRRIRKAFISSPGNLLLSADYSQIELRVLAHVAQDEVLIEAFMNNQDIHKRTAAEVFGVPMDSVGKDMRRAAKAVNFGIVYGLSDFGLSRDLGISRQEAKEYIDNYFRRYPGVKRYMEETIATAREKGYVTTILNRRRYFPDIASKNFHLRSFAERSAINTPIQGSAADIIKLAMLRMHGYLQENSDIGSMILQVHDELIFDVPAALVDQLAVNVEEIMSNAYPLDVPLKVDLQKGPNWYELAPI